MIRIIVQGSTKLDRMRKQWGLSVLIGEDVLFDTFSDPRTLASNLKKCRVDVRKIRHVVISHDHWDHTGGLWWLLEQNPSCTVYACRSSGGELKDRIGSAALRLVEVDKPVMIREGVSTTGEIEGTYAGEPMFEQALVVTRDEKKAVITGCSHPGILSMLERAFGMGEGKISLVLGGFHLMDASEDDLGAIVRALDGRYGLDLFAPFHCTGAHAQNYFRSCLPEQYSAVRNGTVFRFDAGRAIWEKSTGGA